MMIMMNHRVYVLNDNAGHDNGLNDIAGHGNGLNDIDDDNDE